MGRVNNREVHIIEFGAVEQSDGSWLHNDGDKYWYNDEGAVHRDDGPAFIEPEGCVYWYLKDQRYSFDNWLNVLPISDEEKMLLRLQYA